MLKVSYLQSNEDRKSFLKKFDPETTTWIIPHLRSKLEIQSELFERNGFFVEDSVLRASDFWKSLLTRKDASIQVLSTPLLQAEARQWIRNHFQEDVLHPRSAEILVQIAQQSNEILFNRNLKDVIDDWVNNRDTPPSWWKWFQLSSLWAQFMVQEKLLGSNWIPPFLEANGEHLTWHKNIVVDLGVQMRTVEAELFKLLSQSRDVEVLVPHFQGPSRLQSLLQRFDLFETHPPAWSKDSPAPQERRAFFQLSSALLECKFALNQALEWNQKHQIPLEKIEICLTEPEVYWPKIKAIADQLGLPLQRRGTTSLFSRPMIQRLISKLSVLLHEFDQSETETFFFDSETPSLAYHEYVRKYSSLEEPSDLDQIPELRKYLQTSSSSPLWAKEEMIDRVFSLMDEHNSESVQLLVAEMDQVIPSGRKYSSTDWKSLLYSLASQVEIPYEGQESGLSISSLESGESLKTDYRILVGLTDSALRKKKPSPLPYQDLVEIRKDLGFRIEDPELSFLEYELYWKDQNLSTKHVYTYSHSDFQGQLQSPSLFFFEKCLRHGKFEVPHFWNENLMPKLRDGFDQSSESSLPDSDFHLNYLEKKINERLEQDRSEKLLIQGQFSNLSLSATQLEKYTSCPFVFFAEKVLRLKDLPEMDLDLDPMSEGQIFHKLFERLLRENVKSISFPDFKKLFDKITSEIDIHVFDSDLWNSYQLRVYKTLTEFLNFENNWRNDHPHIKILDFEKSFDKTIDIEGEPVRFTGQIDRIDQDLETRNLFLIDYKKKAPVETNPSGWIGKNRIQLLFYLWILSQDSPPTNSLAGACYYTYSIPERNIGIFNEETSLPFQDPSSQGNKKYLVSSESFQSLIDSLKAEITTRIQRIREGDFTPFPKDKDTCKKCSWRKTCRAPHLN